MLVISVTLKLTKLMKSRQVKKNSEILGKTTSEVYPGSENYWLEAFGNVEKTGKPATFENYSKPLNSYYQTYAFPFGKNQVGVLIRDITERKKAEESLKASEARLSCHFIEHSLDAIFLNLPNGTILSTNPAAQRMFGMNEEELRKVGKAGLVAGDEKQRKAEKERESTGRAVY